MIIRNAKNIDLPAIVDIENKSFTHPWSETMITQTFNNENSFFFIVENQDKVIGYLSFDIITSEVYINNIAVLPNFRGHGAGQLLLSKLIDLCKEKMYYFITLEVRVSNQPAINLYKKLGFIKVGQRKNYYHNPTEDCLLMTLNFNNEDLQ